MTKQKRLRSRFEYMASTFGVIIFAIYWGVIATYSEFYFVNPFAQQNPALIVSQALLVLGWVSISTVAPIVLFQFGSGMSKIIALLPYAVLVWPVAIGISQIVNIATTGQDYLRYLIETPIFLVTDLLIPVALFSLWLRLRLHHLD
ncbi:MAG: hypothetical protein RL537_483 [Actinomycetota bacterium]